MAAERVIQLRAFKACWVLRPVTTAVVKIEKVMHNFPREVQSLFPAFAAATI